METPNKTKAKKKVITDDVIISLYMDEVLKNNTEPKNVSIFCKENKITDVDFYKFFGSIDALKQEIWVRFFENAHQTISKEKEYNNYSDKNKLLTLYFTLFEVLTLNRSYVLFSLKENNQGIKNLKSLQKIRNYFRDFVISIIDDGTTSEKDFSKKIKKPLYSEGAWVQFLFILKFWLDDTSKNFEKTDILIEKSVNTVIDLLDTKPLESLFDLGKFLYKEKMN